MKTTLDGAGMSWMGGDVMLAWWIAFLCCWACGWWIHRRLATLPPSVPGPSDRQPDSSWSLIIPARNEENRLPKLLDSLRLLNHPPVEVLVVDDQSDDRTAEIAESFGARVLRSEPLPVGWRGKNWACHQAGLVAQGEVLVFLDADTWLVSGSFPLVQPGQALSLLPYHEVVRADESASLFFNLAMAAGTMPDGLAGQSLVIHRSDYHAVGGHEAVRDQILEHVFLARLLKAAGCRVSCVSGRGRLAMRMYPGGWSELFPGWIKGFASGAGATPVGRLMLVVAWMTGLLLPWFWWPLGLVPLWPCVVAVVLSVMQVAAVARRIGRFPWFASLGYPLALGCFLVLFVISGIKRGRNVEWKGRSIHAG